MTRSFLCSLALALVNLVHADAGAQFLYRSEDGRVTLVSMIHFADPDGKPAARQGTTYLILDDGEPVNVSAELDHRPLEFAMYDETTDRLVVRSFWISRRGLNSRFYASSPAEPEEFKPVLERYGSVCLNGHLGLGEFYFVTRHGPDRVYLASLKGNRVVADMIYESTFEVTFVARGAADSIRLGALTVHALKDNRNPAPFATGLRSMVPKERSDEEYVREIRLWKEDGKWVSAPADKGYRGWYPGMIVGTDIIGADGLTMNATRYVLHDEDTGQDYFGEARLPDIGARVDLLNREWVYLEPKEDRILVKRVPIKGGKERSAYFAVEGEIESAMTGEDGSLLLLAGPRLYRIDEGMEMSLVAELPR
jgi:hypothetical protein